LHGAFFFGLFYDSKNLDKFASINNRKRLKNYFLTKKERYEKAIAYFGANRPFAETELVYRKPYELIVAVILSAQCTDVRVNLITPSFFRKFPDEKVLAKAKEKDVFELIKSCSYPNNKTKNLIGMARTLLEKFNGIVPDDVDELQKLPGVGRKTANVIASVVFNKPAMAVDTHVFRVSARIGLTTNAKNPLEAERQLVKHIPEEKIPLAHHWLILHGRYICKSRRPLCEECGLTEICKYFSINKSSQKK
jgi:endonuclease-3